MVYSYKDIWKVSLPIMLGLLAQNIVQLTGTFFLGHVSDPSQPDWPVFIISPSLQYALVLVSVGRL